MLHNLVIFSVFKSGETPKYENVYPGRFTNSLGGPGHNEDQYATLHPDEPRNSPPSEALQTLSEIPHLAGKYFILERHQIIVPCHSYLLMSVG